MFIRHEQMVNSTTNPTPNTIARTNNSMFVSNDHQSALDNAVVLVVDSKSGHSLGKICKNLAPTQQTISI